MSELERVLREIESATAAAAAPTDLTVAANALERRQRAIADLCGLAGALEALATEEREDVLRRLRLASEAGEKAEQWISSVKNDAMSEWNQWSHIYRALGAAYAKPTLVDCRG